MLTAFTCVLSFSLRSQASSTHPTIDDVKVFYFSSPQTTLAALSSSPFSIASIPQAIITLKTAVNASKIYFKIVNVANDSILYSVNYLINSSTVTNSSGKKMFENSNGFVFVSPGTAFTLQPYSYKVSTEDSLQVVSPVFSKIQ